VVFYIVLKPGQATSPWSHLLHRGRAKTEWDTVVLKHTLLIMYEAAATGTSAAQIIAQQNASSGMWAFGEGLEELYLVVIFYLLWPICFNIVARLPGLWASYRKT
jgi:hypothetical protein